MKKIIFPKTVVLCLMFFVFLVLSDNIYGQQYTDTVYFTNKTLPIPPCVTSITIENWGGGGGGGKDKTLSKADELKEEVVVRILELKIIR